MGVGFTDHPIIKPPTEDEQRWLLENNPEGFKQLLAAHEARIELSVDDPINHGFRFPSWELIIEQLQKWMETFAFGGNGSSKSALGSWLVVQCLLNNPGTRIYCFAQDDDSSTQIQQAYVWKNLPKKYRKDHKTNNGGYIKYTDKNGFTDNSFILDLEDGSEPRKCYFYKYSQYQANKHKFEGYEYGARICNSFDIPAQTIEVNGVTFQMHEIRNIRINIGAWLDEYLESGDLYNTLLYRIPRRGASMLSTFTAIDGMTPFVASKIKGSAVTKTIKTNPRLFDHKTEDKEVEWVREKKHSDEPRAGVGMVFMPSEHNPWSGFDNMLVLHRHKSLIERMVRFHGIPSELVQSLFPHFSTNVNVVDERPEIAPETHTVYMVCDPAGARNYFAIWAAIDRHGYVTILREWPEKDVYGDWAVFATPKWKPGPASNKHGYDIDGYIKLFKEIEDNLGVHVQERFGDSRFFAGSKDGNNLDLFGQFSKAGMHFSPTSGITEEEGIISLNNWFFYNRDAKVDAANRPMLHIHKSCGNLIYSLLNYTLESGKKYEALKDPIDCLRYLCTAFRGNGIMFYDAKEFEKPLATWGY